MAEATQDQDRERRAEGDCTAEGPSEDRTDSEARENAAGDDVRAPATPTERPAALTADALRALVPRLSLVAAVAAGLAALGVSLLSEVGAGRPAGLVLVVLAPIVLALTLRRAIVGPTARVIRGRRRRLAAVWAARVPLLLSLWGWTTAVVPWLSVVVLPLTAFLLVRLVGWWCGMVLEREDAGVLEGKLEDRALAGSLAFFSLVAGLAVGMVFFVGWSTWYALQGLPGTP